jgi:hypothetical protein
MERDSILDRVRKLIDKANSTTFPAEREAFLKKADEMMAIHAIEQFEIEMSRPSQGRTKPVVHKFRMRGEDNASTSWDFDRSLFSLTLAFAHHCRLLVGGLTYTGESVVVGYQSDVDYFDILRTTVMLDLAHKLDPQPDAAQSIGENVARMKEAGFQWDEIFRRFRKHGMLAQYADQPFSKPIGLWMYGQYKKFCQETGRLQTRANPKQWMEDFSRGYVEEINARLREMRLSTEEAVAGTGKGLVLAGMEEELKEFYYDLFPDRRPHPADCQCDTCHFRKCEDSTCTRTRCVEARKPVRARKGAIRYRRVSDEARTAGRRAGSRADLSGGKRVGGNKGLNA